MSYFYFPIYKALRKVLFLGNSYQRSYKGLIFQFNKVFNILEKFSFKELTKLS